jgi:O-antigen/teichoic acid export membrane protein
VGPSRALDLLTTLLGSRLARQFGVLTASQGLGMFLSFALTVLMTRGLDVASYGAFRYATTFLAMGVTVLHFGWPYSAARLLALERQHSSQEEIVGTCAIAVMVSTVVGTVATMAVFFVVQALGYHLPTALIYVAPFFYVTLGQYMITSICQGLNRISLLSSQQILPYLLILPATAVQLFLFRKYSYQAALITYLAAFTIVIAVGFRGLGFKFSQGRKWFGLMTTENRRTGFPIYIGGLFGVASAQIVAMWVAEFVSLTRYGQYALALAVSAPVSVLVSSVGTVTFRSGLSSKSLSAKVLSASLGFSVLLAAAFFAATEILLVRAFGDQYGPSVQMAQVMGFGGLMIGWGDIFQRFLGAHGQGKVLGSAAVLTGSIGILSAAFLVPRWNAYGAIASSILAAATYFGSMLLLYLRHTMSDDPPLASQT